MTEDKTYARLARHLPKEPPHPIYNAAHFHAAMYVAASIKGFLVSACAVAGTRSGLCYPGAWRCKPHI